MVFLRGVEVLVLNGRGQGGGLGMFVSWSGCWLPGLVYLVKVHQDIYLHFGLLSVFTLYFNDSSTIATGKSKEQKRRGLYNLMCEMTQLRTGTRGITF